MWIYDRWGSQLFYSQDVEKTWDGTYKNKLVPNGVYTYKIKIIHLGNRHIDMIGTITVI